MKPVPKLIPQPKPKPNTKLKQKLKPKPKSNLKYVLRNIVLLL